MVEGRFRSRTFRRVYGTTPGGTNRIDYKKRKPSHTRCICGVVLKGVPRERPVKMTHMAKTKKRPSRPYGGVLCSKCMRKKIVEAARKA